MANTDVTIRMDETTKTELQNLMNDLGMDVNKPLESRRCHLDLQDKKHRILKH